MYWNEIKWKNYVVSKNKIVSKKWYFFPFIYIRLFHSLHKMSFSWIKKTIIFNWVIILTNKLIKNIIIFYFPYLFNKNQTTDTCPNSLFLLLSTTSSPQKSKYCKCLGISLYTNNLAISNNLTITDTNKVIVAMYFKKVLYVNTTGFNISVVNMFIYVCPRSSSMETPKYTIRYTTLLSV